MVDALLRLHGNWAAISKLRSTWLEEIHNEAQNENNPPYNNLMCVDNPCLLKKMKKNPSGRFTMKQKMKTIQVVEV